MNLNHPEATRPAKMETNRGRSGYPEAAALQRAYRAM